MNRKHESHPLVSVVVTVFNVAPYLRECIAALLSQTYTYIEVIIVDDGSSDGSSEQCDEIASLDNRVIVIHQKHRGFGPASNTGIDAASGKYLMFCDGDDYYLDHAVESMVRVIEATGVEVAHAAGLAFDGISGDVCNVPSVNTIAVPHIYTNDVLLRKDIDENFHLLSVYCWVNIINLGWLRRKKIRWPTVPINHVDNPFHCLLMLKTKRLALVRSQICAHRMNRVGSAMYHVDVDQVYSAMQLSEKIMRQSNSAILLRSFYHVLFADFYEYWKRNREVMKKMKRVVARVMRQGIKLDKETQHACVLIQQYSPYREFAKKTVKFMTPYGIAKLLNW